MGRRPNALLVEFFERGPKLDDNSNRYPHTCKRCGEQFAKGRVDTLTYHILRKCVNITQEDREWVFRQIPQLPERVGNKKETVRPLSAQVAQEEVQSALPMYQLPQHSALDTLAEVSRRHLDYSTQRSNNENRQQGTVKTLPQLLAEQALVTELQQHLVQAASAADQQLEQAQAENVQSARKNSTVDPQLSEMDTNTQSVPDNPAAAGNVDDDSRTMVWNPTAASAQTFGSLSIPSNQPNPGFGLLQHASKHKKRGRFDDTRRKEVSEIRKRGACIRCRMLKKPCSEGTPCSTCNAVENGRLWKGKCLRTRLADESTLWTVDFFHSRARIEVSAAIHGLEQIQVTGLFEGRFCSTSSLSFSFEAKAYEGYGGGAEKLDPALNSDILLVLEHHEIAAFKLSEYVKGVTDVLIAEEPSEFIRATLLQAQYLISTDETAKASAALEQHSSRSCYNLQNQLLKDVIELWVRSRLLTSSKQHQLQLRFESSKLPETVPEELEWELQGDNSISRDIPPSSTSYQLVRCQLLAAIESPCGKLSKSIMNELEKRLLRRQQTSRFATLLSAVILLNCVERMTGLYRLLDTGEEEQGKHPRQQTLLRHDTGEQSEQSTENLEIETTWSDNADRLGDHHNTRSLGTPLSRLWPQGQHFSELLTMLLRMRSLQPKTIPTHNGTLVVSQEFSFPVHLNGRPVREQIDEQTTVAAAWLDPLRLDAADLCRKRDGPLPEKDEGVEAWHMKFISGLLLPGPTRLQPLEDSPHHLVPSEI